jgi:hypothetical protein
LTNAGSNDGFIVKYNSDGTPLWARRLGGTGYELTNSVSTDSTGNIVVAVQYNSNPVTIFAADGSTAFTTFTNSGSYDALVVKYDSAGTPQWARRLGGTGDERLNSISTDSTGNILVAGIYNSNPATIFAADGSTAFTTLANAGGNDGFVVKYDSAGTPQWARRLGGTGYEVTNSVSTDSTGNILVAGIYASNPLTIFAADGSTAFTTLANAGGNDGFVVKYDSAGTPQWARRIGGTLNDVGNSVSTDSTGNIIVAGQYESNPVTIFAADGTTFTALSNSGSSDGFVVKYNPEGTPQWARRVGGTGGDRFQSVTTDSSGNIVVTGQYSFSPVTIFAADGTTFTTLSNSGNGDGFVVKYNPEGTPQWGRRLGGTDFDGGNSVSTDSTGNIIVAGFYASNPLTIFAADGSTFTTLTNSGGNDGFVVKYDSAGTPLWARRLGGTTSDSATTVVSDSNGNIVVVGTYNSNPLTIT